MFGRILPWWRTRGRRIYRFHDGSCWRAVDPIELHERLEAAAGDWEKLLGILAAAPLPPGSGAAIEERRRKEQAEALDRLVTAARAAFGVTALADTGRGLTRAETVALVADYVVWLGGAADLAGPFATSPRRASPLMPADSPTSPSSDSGDAGGGSLNPEPDATSGP